MIRKASIILEPVNSKEVLEALQKEIDELVLEQARIEEDLDWCKEQLIREMQK